MVKYCYIKVNFMHRKKKVSPRLADSKAKRKIIIKSIYRAMHGPLMDQVGALTLWGSAFVSLESIGMYFVA